MRRPVKTETSTRGSGEKRRFERIPAWTVPPLLLLWLYGFAKLTGVA